MTPICSDEEFIDTFHRTGGSIREVAKILGCAERTAHQKRRAIEAKRREPLLSKQPHSPDYAVELLEFPDWNHIEIKNGLLIVFSDAHLVPGHKSTAHRALLKFIHELKPDALIENGDLLDFASISRHHRIGWDKQMSVKVEMEWAGDCMHEFVKIGPKRMQKKKTVGNHDQRFSGHISNNLGAYEGVKGFSLQDHLPGWPFSWAVRVNDDQLEVTHRWKSGKHAVYLNAVHSGISYATGHLHSQKVEPMTDLRGDRWGVDVGTLASVYGPHFRYLEAKPRDWRSGFAAFRFVNHKLRMPELIRVIDEEKGIVEFRGQDVHV